MRPSTTKGSADNQISIDSSMERLMSTRSPVRLRPILEIGAKKVGDNEPRALERIAE